MCPSSGFCRPLRGDDDDRLSASAWLRLNGLFVHGRHIISCQSLPPLVWSFGCGRMAPKRSFKTQDNLNVPFFPLPLGFCFGGIARGLHVLDFQQARFAKSISIDNSTSERVSNLIWGTDLCRKEPLKSERGMLALPWQHFQQTKEPKRNPPGFLFGCFICFL